MHVGGALQQVAARLSSSRPPPTLLLLLPQWVGEVMFAAPEGLVRQQINDQVPSGCPEHGTSFIPVLGTKGCNPHLWPRVISNKKGQIIVGTLLVITIRSLQPLWLESISQMLV